MRFCAKLLTGFPSILAGVFAYGAVVLVTGGYSAVAGAVALSILMLPTIILTSEDAIRMVPARMRDAAIGMGATRTQTVWMVLLPTALPGILTGVMLAVARAAGETAPLLFTALFSNYWLWSGGQRQPDAADGVTGCAHLQLRRHAVRRIRSNWPGRRPWFSCCSSSSPTSSARASRRDRSSTRRSRFMSSIETAVDPAEPQRRRYASRRLGRRTMSDDVVIDCHIKRLALRHLQGRSRHAIPIKKNSITAFIGPSGCGKSTVLRCLNRMNDLVRGFRFEGHVRFRGRDIYDHSIDPVAVRRFIGMVFQQPNPFATSIFNNVAFGLRLNGFKGEHGREGRAGAARAPRCGTK